MWHCFNDGFVSAVQDRNKLDSLVIRSRKKKILQNLFPNAEIIVGGSTDYNYRVFCSKKEWSKIVADRIMNIGYDNFKNSVSDDDLHNLYAKFWSLHYAYQSAG